MIIYFTRQFIVGRFAVPLTPVQSGGGGTGGVGAPGFGNDLEPPGIEEAPELSEPTIAETLSAVASAVATKTALIADDTIDVGVEPVEGTSLGDSRRPGYGGGRGGGIGGGIGSGFGPGRGGPPEPRREIRFEPANLQEYAQWLDYFKIELGVLGRDNKVYYAYNLSREKPEMRVGDPAQEQRLYMNPANSPFAALDRQLAAKAGIADKGEIILQFYPAEAQDILYDLEQKRAGGRTRNRFATPSFASRGPAIVLNLVWKSNSTDSGARGPASMSVEQVHRGTRAAQASVRSPRRQVARHGRKSGAAAIRQGAGRVSRAEEASVPAAGDRRPQTAVSRRCRSQCDITAR